MLYLLEKNSTEVTNTVEIFRTNVQNLACANDILKKLTKAFPDYEMNFDLEDCDRILRVAGENICTHAITEFMIRLEIDCENME